MSPPVERTVPIPGGECSLVDSFLGHEEGELIQQQLHTQVAWTQPVISMFGRQVPSPRLAAWYGDSDAVYRYSGLVNHPLPWLPVMDSLRRRIERTIHHRFNSVLINLYRDGSDAMGWHADDERELGSEPTIASLSLGGMRRFCLRHRRKQIPTINLDLPHGSLLVMAGATQRNWKHCVPRTRKLVAPRINLTFRNVTTK